MAWMQIETTKAALDITTTRAQINIQSRPARMRIHRKPAEMHIERNDPKMKIDWDMYNAQVGMDRPMAMMERFAKHADQKAREGISRIVSDGDQLAQINGPSTADLAYVHMMERNKVELSHITKWDRPIINWEGGGITVNWSAHEFEIEWDTDTMPIITVDPHEVEIRVRNYPSVKISLTKEYYDSLDKARKLDMQV